MVVGPAAWASIEAPGARPGKSACVSVLDTDTQETKSIQGLGFDVSRMAFMSKTGGAPDPGHIHEHVAGVPAEDEVLTGNCG